MKQGFDPDILAVAKEIQALRNEGKLEGVRQIILHCDPKGNEIKVVQFDKTERFSLNPIG